MTSVVVSEQKESSGTIATASGGAEAVCVAKYTRWQLPDGSSADGGRTSGTTRTGTTGRRSAVTTGLKCTLESVVGQALRLREFEAHRPPPKSIQRKGTPLPYS